MNFVHLAIDGVYEIHNFSVNDERGVFVKTFNEELFQKIDFKDSFKESYYSSSAKNVIRGMHFQLSPQEHEKLIYVTEGEILDVVVDLRKKSSTFKKFLTIKLSAFGSSIFIPKGCAHGFLTLSASATVVYNVTTIYSPSNDSGILWNSFGYNWDIEVPIISERDQSFKRLEDFKSPF